MEIPVWPIAGVGRSEVWMIPGEAELGDNVDFLEQSFAELSELGKKYQALQNSAASGAVSPEWVSEVNEVAERTDIKFLGEVDKVLAIAHSVVAGKHGGKIMLENEPERGTTFRFRLPIESESNNRFEK